MSKLAPAPIPRTGLLLGFEQIGGAFNRSAKTAQRWIRAGVIPYKRLPDGTHVTSLGAITCWILEDSDAR